MIGVSFPFARPFDAVLAVDWVADRLAEGRVGAIEARVWGFDARATAKPNREPSFTLTPVAATVDMQFGAQGETAWLAGYIRRRVRSLMKSDD